MASERGDPLFGIVVASPEEGRERLKTRLCWCGLSISQVGVSEEWRPVASLLPGTSGRHKRDIGGEFGRILAVCYVRF